MTRKRNILISGANRGIGKRIALKALDDGHNVSIGIRDLRSIKNSELEPTNQKVGSLLLNKYEAKEIDSAKLWVKNTVNHFKSIDTIIHCAGIFNKTELLFKESERKSIDELIKVNLMGPWDLTKVAWKELVQDGEARVIVISSMSGKRCKGSLAGYTVSKFALMGLCQNIRNEGWNKGIRVTAICPGWVNTDMTSEVRTINKIEMTQPEDLANLCSQILKLPNSCIPFEVCINCNLETSL